MSMQGRLDGGGLEGMHRSRGKKPLLRAWFGFLREGDIEVSILKINGIKNKEKKNLRNTINNQFVKSNVILPIS